MNARLPVGFYFRYRLITLRLNTRSDFVFPEIVGFFISLLGEKHVLISSKPEMEIPMLPQVFIGLLSLLWGIFKAAPGGEVEIESAETVPPTLEQIRISTPGRNVFSFLKVYLLPG